MNWDKMTAEPKSADGVAAANPIGLTNKYDSFMINMIINTTCPQKVVQVYRLFTIYYIDKLLVPQYTR